MTTMPLCLNFDRHACDDDHIELYDVARTLGVSLDALGDLMGLPASVIYDPDARITPTVQTQLRDLIAILEILMTRFDSVHALINAVARYRISKLGGHTIRRLFHAGRSRDVLRVLRCAAFPLPSSMGGRFDVPATA